MFKDLTYNELMKRASLFFALVISFWIPQYKFTLSLFIVLWFLFNLLQGKFLFRIKENYSKRNLVFFVFQILLFLLISLSYFVSDDKEYASIIIVKELSFIIFPILFFLSGKLFFKNKILFLKLFVLGNIVASILSIINFFYSACSFDNLGNFVFNAFDEVGRSLYTYSYFSIFHHPAYFSMYLVFSIAILFYLKKQTNFFNTKKRTVLFYVLLLFISVIIFLLSSRAGIFSLFLLFLWKLFQYIKNNTNLFVKFISIFVFIASIVVISQNTRIISTYKQIEGVFIDGKKSDYYPTRLILWEAATKVIEENFYFGTGTGDAISILMKEVGNENVRKGKVKALNAHNQFLDTFLSLGVFGFLLLLSIIIYSLYIAIKNKSELFIVLISLLCFNFLFESMLNTIAGIVFFVYFLNFFVFVFEEDSEASKKQVKLPKSNLTNI